MPCCHYFRHRHYAIRLSLFRHFAIAAAITPHYCRHYRFRHIDAITLADMLLSPPLMILRHELSRHFFFAQYAARKRQARSVL
jgi:hypothetical protein